MPTGPETPAIADPHPDQPTIALSSTEAEYRGTVVVTCEAIWLKQLLKDLHVEVFNPTTIYYYNLNIIQLVKNPVIHARTKEIEVHYHFVREHVLSSECSDGSAEHRHLHQAPWSRKVAAILRCAWVVGP